MNKPLIAALAALFVLGMTAELLAQARRPGRPGRGAARGARQAENEAKRDERALDKRLGDAGTDGAGDPDDDRPIYSGAEFNEAQIRNETAKFLKDHDKDRDGKLSAYEFAGSGYSPDTFRLADRNKDGLLNEDDIRIFLREALPARVAKDILDKETEKLMKKHDRNKNGEVDAEEFRGNDADFEEIDLDADGTITEAEMRAHARAEFEDKHRSRLPNDVSRFDAEAERRADEAERRADAQAARDEAREKAEERRREREKAKDEKGQPDAPGGDEPGTDK